ncbi:hypothetical protein [Streptomyces sp. NPDC002540]
MEQSKMFRQTLYAHARVKQSDVDSIAAVSRDYDQPGTWTPAGSSSRLRRKLLQNMQREGGIGASSDQASVIKDLGR